MTTLIECSNKTAIDRQGGVSGDWTNVYGQPIKVNTGDFINIKQVFVDNNNGNAQNITLNQDYVINMEFGYYVLDYTDGGKTYKPNRDPGGQGNLYVDGNVYIWRDHERNPEFSDFELVVEKGIYTPDELATHINRKLTTIDINNFDPKEHYANSSPFMKNTGDAGGGERFYRQDIDKTGDDTDYFEYNQHAHVIGASQLEVVWNQNDNNKYLFNYHTPCTHDGQPCVLWVKIIEMPEDEEWYLPISRFCGIYFTQWNDPDNFFKDILKIDMSKTLVSFDANAKISHDLNKTLGSKVTGGLVTIESVLKSKKGIGTLATDYDDDENVSVIQPDETYSIEADSMYQPNLSGGYYLIEVSNFHNDFRDDTDIRKNIMAILSQQNQSENNFITGYGGECSVSWQNKREPFLLSQIKCRVLDPHTKKPLTFLGDNNSIILEIVRAEPIKKK